MSFRSTDQQRIRCWCTNRVAAMVNDGLVADMDMLDFSKTFDVLYMVLLRKLRD